MKVPERIWADREDDWTDGDGKHLVGGTWQHFDLTGRGVQLIRKDVHEAAVAAARAEGMREGLLKAAEISKPKSKVKQKHGKWVTGANEASAASHARAVEIETAIRAAAEASK